MQNSKKSFSTPPTEYHQNVCFTSHGIRIRKGSLAWMVRYAPQSPEKKHYYFPILQRCLGKVPSKVYRATMQMMAESWEYPYERHFDVDKVMYHPLELQTIF